MVFLIQLQNNMMHPEKALALYRSVNKQISKNSVDGIYYYYQLQLQYVYSLIGLKKYSEASDILENIISDIDSRFGKSNTFYLRALAFKSSIYAGTKKYKASIALLKEIIQMKKELGLNYTSETHKIGKIYYYKFKDYKKALDYFKKAIELDEKNRINPTESSGYFYKNLGMAYYHNSKNSEALKYLYLSKNIFGNIQVDHEDILKFISEMITYLESL